jgi:hypothetical protein
MAYVLLLGLGRFVVLVRVREGYTVKLHRHIALLEVGDPGIIDALEATDDWHEQHLRRVSPTTVALLIEQAEPVADKLRKLGFMPRIVER